MPGENLGQQSQRLVGGDTVSEATQEALGLVSLGGSCSGCLLRNDWVVTAAHCVEMKDAEGNPIPNQVVAPASLSVTANWGGGQVRPVTRIETLRPSDVALLQVATPFATDSLPDGQTRLMNDDDQFPYFGSEGGMYLTVFGRGIHVFATGEGATATPASGDGQYRVGFAKVFRTEDERYWFSSGTGDYIAGGDSGGPSFAMAYSGYVLVGVHSLATVERLPGKSASPDPWAWVSATPEAADAPLRYLRDRIFDIIGRAASPAPPPLGFIGVFSYDGPDPDDVAIATFQFRGSVARERGFPTAFPNFHQARHGLDHVGGTIFLHRDSVEWRNPSQAELGIEKPHDFGERMRAAAKYASAQGFPGAVPAFLDADYGDGVRMGLFLLTHAAAEWRDVSLYDLDLKPEDLGDVGRRFRATNDYAFNNGFVGGFPNMFHVTKEIFDVRRGGRVVDTVCGTMLLKQGAAEWADVLLFRDPR